LGRLSRYNRDKKGSFKISLEFYDWELSITIGALRAVRRAREGKCGKAYLTYLAKLERKFSEALGQVLRAEFRDLKLKDGQRELAL